MIRTDIVLPLRRVGIITAKSIIASGGCPDLFSEPSQITSVQVLYDADNIYFGVTLNQKKRKKPGNRNLNCVKRRSMRGRRPSNLERMRIRSGSKNTKMKEKSSKPGVNSKYSRLW